MLIRVYYEDTDCQGIVYHSKYINFCERARSELFFQKGLTPQGEDDYFVARKIECDYFLPAYFADSLEVFSKVIEIKRSSLIMEQQIKRSDQIIFKMLITLVYLKDGKPTRIPETKLNILR